MINNIEKGSFLKLFNRGGYVLDFSTNDFDNFTLDSIGRALCNEFGLLCIPADTRSPIPVIPVHSVGNLQYMWQS